MITFSNIVRHDNLPFEDYLKIPGNSHSYLKAEKFGITPIFKETEKVKVGKIVDCILTDPGSVNMRDPFYKIAREFTALIKSEFGYIITAFQKQVSYTADLEHKGFVMPAKFRLDWLIPDYAVVDLKVTYEKDIRALIKFMGYDNQLFGYARAARVQKKFLMVHSVPLKRTELIMLPDAAPHNEFWANKILKFGRVAA